jgi:hypothetical protein
MALRIREADENEPSEERFSEEAQEKSERDHASPTHKADRHYQMKKKTNIIGASAKFYGCAATRAMPGLRRT